MKLNEIYQGDCLEVLKTLPDESIHCCVTSPPYWGLRDYGHDGQIGLEETPDRFIANLMDVFSEVYRVLKNDGTLWLNIGDTYAAHKDCKSVADTMRIGGNSEEANIIDKGKSHSRNSKMLKSVGLKNKDLVGIPWKLASALQAGLFFCGECEQESQATIRLNDGRLLCKNCGQCQHPNTPIDSSWHLRQDIIWHKPNPMPESVTDRCTKAHEYIFLLSKSQKYYYDNEAIKLPCLTSDNSERDRDNTKLNNTPGRTRMAGLKTNQYELANKRSVWTVNTKPYSDAHFATFPEELIVDCIKAGTKDGGVILDPFFGAGTTGLVAQKLGRNFIGIELNPEYISIAKNRLQRELGMFYKKSA